MTTDVLIVEDEAVVVRSALRVLEPEGLTIRSAGDVAEGLEELRRSSFKVVLCDLMLPGESGFRVLETVARADPETQVIAVTGYTTSDHVVESFALGAFDFLPKPFDVDELLAIVGRALRFFDHLRRGEEVDVAGGSRRADAVDRRFLGRHSWASIDEDGAATLGIGPSLAGSVAGVSAVTTARPESSTVQGRECAAIRDEEGREHRVWAPLSGRVLVINEALAGDPTLPVRDPFGDGWLLRVVPEDRDEEMSRLGSD